MVETMKIIQLVTTQVPTPPIGWRDALFCLTAEGKAFEFNFAKRVWEELAFPETPVPVT